MFNKKPISLLTAAYLVALSLIAGMLVGAHLVVKRVIAEQAQSAKTINIAGRQRMLSQRTALFMADAIMGNRVEAQNRLLESINLFEKSHKALTKGDAEIGLTGEMSDSLYEIYYREPYHLDRSTQQYIRDVRTILDEGDKLTNKNQIFQRAKDLAEGELLTNLNIAVKAYEKEADEKIEKLIDIQRLSILAILIVIVLEALVIFRPLIHRIKKYSDRIEAIASTDSLTGILNRRSVLEIFDKELSRAKRHDHDLSLLICDIDYFKKVNDTYGHQIGDDALKHFSSLIGKAIREEDVFGRIGGEEFVVLFPLTAKNDAFTIAEKLRAILEKCPLTFKHKGEDIKLTLTASFGVSAYDKFKDTGADDMYRRADRALYIAKENGRNRVEGN